MNASHCNDTYSYGISAGCFIIFKVQEYLYHGCVNLKFKTIQDLTIHIISFLNIRNFRLHNVV